MLVIHETFYVVRRNRKSAVAWTADVEPGMYIHALISLSGVGDKTPSVNICVSEDGKVENMRRVERVLSLHDLCNVIDSQEETEKRTSKPVFTVAVANDKGEAHIEAAKKLRTLRTHR